MGGELRHGVFVELEDDFFFVVGGEVPVGYGCCGGGEGVGGPGVAFPGVGAAGGAGVVAGVGIVVVVAGVAGVAVLVVVVVADVVAIVATGAAAAALPVTNQVFSHIDRIWLVRVLWILTLNIG